MELRLRPWEWESSRGEEQMAGDKPCRVGTANLGLGWKPTKGRSRFEQQHQGKFCAPVDKEGDGAASPHHFQSTLSASWSPYADRYQMPVWFVWYPGTCMTQMSTSWDRCR